MKKKRILLIALCVACVLMGVAGGFGAYFWRRSVEWPGKAQNMNMHTDFQKPENLPAGNGQKVKVILLMGQSNATGVGRLKYLKENTTPEQYAKYEGGFDSVLINYCVDNHTNCSNGEFVNVDLGCSVWPDEVFGPEVGMAEKFSDVWGDEKVIVLKYTYSGTSLYYQWLAYGKRGSIYEAMYKYVNTYMKALLDAGYDARIGAVCWMQGESDSFEEHVYNRYYEIQDNFVSYLREDFAKYAEEGGICFIDAGISNSPCWPGYREVNAAKVQMAKDSDLNYYFSTIDEGLEWGVEPEESPDLALRCYEHPQTRAFVWRIRHSCLQRAQRKIKTIDICSKIWYTVYAKRKALLYEVYSCNMGKCFYKPPIMVDYRMKIPVVNHVFLDRRTPKMHIYLEIFGYIGTALVIVSMMMTSVVKLRIINMCGGLISLIYAICVNTWPVVVLNTCLICINFLQTLRQLRHKSDFTELKLDANDLTVQHFLSVNAEDVQKYFPNYCLQAHRETEIHMIYVECEAVGVLVGTRASDVYRIEMDYVVPKYRDIAVGKFLFPQLKEQGVNMLTAASASREHDQYLKKLGFSEDSGILLRDL